MQFLARKSNKKAVCSLRAWQQPENGREGPAAHKTTHAPSVHQGMVKNSFSLTKAFLKRKYTQDHAADGPWLPTTAGSSG